MQKAAKPSGRMQVPIQNLPFAAAFKYALYTHGYVMVAGYPHFNTSTRSGDPPGASLAEGGETCPYRTRALRISDDEILDDRDMATAFVSDAVLQCLLWAMHRKSLLRTDIRDGDIPGVRVPPLPSLLEFLSVRSAVCTAKSPLDACHKHLKQSPTTKRSRPRLCTRVRLLVQLRLITDLLPVLLPGIQRDYPHTRVALDVQATAMPRVAFIDGIGMLLDASYDTDVYVLPHSTAGGVTAADVVGPSQGMRVATPWRKRAVDAAAVHGHASRSRPRLTAAHDGTNGRATQHAHGGRTAGFGTADKVLVAQLAANVSLVASVGYEGVSIPQLEVRYSVKHSKYPIDATKWDSTVEWLSKAAKSSLGLKELTETFLRPSVRELIQPRDVSTRYRDGWYQVSANVHVNASRIHL